MKLLHSIPILLVILFTTRFSIAQPASQQQLDNMNRILYNYPGLFHGTSLEKTSGKLSPNIERYDRKSTSSLHGEYELFNLKFTGGLKNNVSNELLACNDIRNAATVAGLPLLYDAGTVNCTRSIMFQSGRYYLEDYSEYRNIHLLKGEKVIFQPRSKVWQPSTEDMIIGAVFAGLGAAGMFIPSKPDFSSEGKVGPQMLFVFSASSFLVGTGAFIAGVFHHTKVVQQPYDPAIDKDQMKLLANDANKNVLDAIERVLTRGNIKVADKNAGSQGIPQKVKAYYDHLEFMLGRESSILSYKDLYIQGITTFQGGKVFEVGNFEFKSTVYNDRNELEKNFDYIRNTIEKQAEEKVYADQLAVFRPFAEKYRSMYDKPVMSEDQRKKVVQANVMREQGQFADAISTLKSALQMDPLAYPEGYANLAFLYERIKNYEEAILNMKKYIMLVPDADDARGSQDKIYEWELLLRK